MKAVNRLLAVAAMTMMVGSVACERRTSLDGVWEPRRVRLQWLKWDSSASRYNRDTSTSDLTEVSYFVLDNRGQVMSSSEDLLEATTGGDYSVKATQSGVTLVFVGTLKRTSPDSLCGDIFSCVGDTMRVDLLRVGDRNGRLPQPAYLARYNVASYWRMINAQFGGSLYWRSLRNRRAVVDSIPIPGVDTAAVAYVRAVGAVLGELALLGDERSMWDPAMTPESSGSGIFKTIQAAREKLTSASMEGSTGSPRAQQLLRRLDDIEQDALRLWRREGELRAQLSVRYGVNFPALRVFEGTEASR
jgi:hypothetical protein